MKYRLSIAVSALIYSGVCLAQAPVVDVNAPQQTSILPAGATITNAQLESRLAVLERIIESRSDTQQRMQQQIDNLQEDIGNITGSIELHNHQLEQILERQRQLFLELEERFEALQSQSTSVANNINSTGTSNAGAPPQGEQAAYQAAVNLILQDQDYDNAVPAFRDFISKYPNSDLSDNAHYWLGQLLYNDQKWAAAQEQFSQVVEKFAGSTKRADSLLKLGMIAKNTGDTNLATQYFEQVVEEYPTTTPARLANEQLAGG